MATRSSELVERIKADWTRAIQAMKIVSYSKEELEKMKLARTESEVEKCKEIQEREQKSKKSLNRRESKDTP
ncbi:hypothetical protein ECANGB1_1911 [Enterospora canceri]|uniref:Uncharacterized protein n=1 Tax=Enterospora canceri TaxID=1081671 RepID=A0A1Y1S8W9_9MICR|nr:hypothetical protein ECANGB1_1911 [Enterospora canceri]